MPLTFISDDDFALHANEARYVADKAEEYIRVLQAVVETAKAAADASSITAEQTCSLLEQKFLSLSTEFSELESRNAQFRSSLEQRDSELGDVKAQKHQLHLQLMEKDAEIGRLRTEVSELEKDKRQLIELAGQKDMVISEKNALVNSYLEKIVNLTEKGAKKEARLSEVEVELARSQAACVRLTEEKELVQRHNTWLNDELTTKADSLIELRKIHAQVQEDLSAKLSDADRRLNECCSSLKWNKERVKELEIMLTSLQEELTSSKDAAAANEERFSAEVSTASKLVDLYKESSEEWSRKAGELEGVIKALETRMRQVEDSYKEKLEKEVTLRKVLEKEAVNLQQKLEKSEAEIENRRKENELNLLPIVSYAGERWMDKLDTEKVIQDNGMVVPRIPAGVSGTSLAASLLRDGWSLAKIYEKYQEAVDALRHEQLGRKESEAILQRVLCELEEKAGVILDERAEYERMVESYSVINQKLQQSIDERASLEKTIQELKVDLRRQEREYCLAKKEIVDLQKQVTVLLKECRDIQLRCENTSDGQTHDTAIIATVEMDFESDAEKVISENLLTFRGINGLVEQNVQLRSLVRSLSEQIQNSEMEFKESPGSVKLQERLEVELRKHIEEAETKVATVLSRAEEQGHMIESLHTAVAMYKRLYEEEHSLRSSYSHPSNSSQVAENGRKDLLLLLDSSQEASKKVHERAAEQVRSLEEELAKSRSDIISLRSERDKFVLDLKFARERLDGFLKEHEHQRSEMNGVSARNVELSHLIVEYQRKVRESSESLLASEELSQKLHMEVSVLKQEKEMLSNAEKRACDEVRCLSERVYRLQASLDTIQSAEQVREEARAVERRKQEEFIKQLERDWAEAKKEVQQERDHVRALTSDREDTMKSAVRQVEEMRKELADALHAVTAAETRAAVAEVKLSDLEKKIKTSNVKVVSADDAGVPSISTTEVVTDLLMAKEEIEKLKEEAQANKEHMLQYKSIAQVNEAALKQIEIAHDNFKIESERLKDSLEAELQSLRKKISELESELISKSEEVAAAATEKEDTLSSALEEVARLRDECSKKSSQILLLETRVSNLSEDLEKEHDRSRAAQTNYERQVILQSETIQELTKTSQTLASLQQEAADLRKSVNALSTENRELKAKWEEEKSMMERAKNEAEKKYDELNEQNKILHDRLEALHIQLAEKARNAASNSSGATAPDACDSGLESVVSYLRRSKEIAETEISLLKQEKLRLQSKLESALKSAENAQALLHAERSNSRATLFSEEELKSLQLQVREINLLRESNAQLREENKHNFEECQKLREVVQKAQSQSGCLETLLHEKEVKIEACRKEIEMERIEKDHLQKRISELLERSRSIDVEEYDRMKDDLQQMQEEMKEKEVRMQEIENDGMKLQDTILKLEQELTKSKAELHQKEKKISDILHTESSLKSEVEKQKKLLVQWKKKSDSLSKEKDEIVEEKQALARQIEDLKQGKRSMGNVSGEQAMKEKDEKDHRIQTLEKIVERHREELRKEKEDRRAEITLRQSTEKALESFRAVGQLQSIYKSKVELHNQALEQLIGEFSEGNLLEDIPAALLCRSILDDFVALLSAIEDIINVLGNGPSDSSSTGVSTPVAPASSTATTISSVVPTTSALSAKTTEEKDTRLPLSTTVSSTATTISLVGPSTGALSAKTTEEKDARLPVSKTSVETRKTGRKLVRPKLVKAEEPLGDVEMSEADGSNTGRKSAPPHDSEVQHSQSLVYLPVVHKRQASSASELNEQLLNEEERNSDVVAPGLKRIKVSDSQEIIAEGQSTNFENQMHLPAEEIPDFEADLPQVLNECAVDEKEEAGSVIETQNENIEFKPTVSELDLDEDPKDQATQDNQQSAMGSESEREEGELVPDLVEAEEGGDMPNMIGSPEAGEDILEVGVTPLASPARFDEETVDTAEKKLGGSNSTEVSNEDKSKVDVIRATEVPSQLTDVNHQNKIENDQVSATPSDVAERTSAPDVEVDVSRNVATSSEVDVSGLVSPNAEAEDVKQVSPASSSSTVVNLAERARQRAMLRQSGAGVLPPAARGRGRVLRARGARAARGGRSSHGQSPGQQGF